MMNGELVSTHIKATENTTVAKLSVIDQIKLLFHKVSNEDAAELDAAEKLSASQLREKASLMSLFDGATKKITDGEAQSVTLQVSSRYIPYLDEVTDAKYGMGRFFDFEIKKKDLPINVDYKFLVIISRKVS